MEYKLRISEWPESERPRERLIEHGPEHLSDVELLAIILRTGPSGKTVIDLARELLVEARGLRGLDTKSTSELCQMHGIGVAKAAQIKAALELGKRLQLESNGNIKHFRNSHDIFEFIRPEIANAAREQFVVLLLTARNRLIVHKRLFEGSVTESHVDAREVVKLAVNERAVNIVFVHNHPSGDPAPSADDIRMTRKLQLACQTVDIKVLDHIIIGGDRYVSLADDGLL